MTIYIRTANQQDSENITGLVKSLAHYYLQDAKSALPSWFANTITIGAFTDRMIDPQYSNYVYQLGSSILGYILIKDGNHLYHLFVLEQYQNQGIARQLWEYTMTQHLAQKYTLRSSMFAVPFYKKLGLVESGAIGHKDGISYQPMQLIT